MTSIEQVEARLELDALLTRVRDRTAAEIVILRGILGCTVEETASLMGWERWWEVSRAERAAVADMTGIERSLPRACASPAASSLTPR